jgi:hypothetical protein
MRIILSLQELLFSGCMLFYKFLYLKLKSKFAPAKNIYLLLDTLFLALMSSLFTNNFTISSEFPVMIYYLAVANNFWQRCLKMRQRLLNARFE